MNREIKFRGISKETGDFVYGGYGVLGKDTDIEKHIIVVSTLDNHPNTERFYFTDVEVEKESVGQFTGLTDKNGREIYERDIVELYFTEYYSNDCVTVDFPSKVKGYISFSSGGWFLNEKDSTWFYLYDMDECSELEIIGNIHDNP